MLSIGNDVLRLQDYQVRHLYSGLDELHFDISIYDDQYALIAEEVQIVDRAGQTYAVKAIDGGNETVKVKAQLDLDELKAELFVGYTNGSATVAATVSGVLPEGWTADDQSGIQIKRTIDAPGATAGRGGVTLPPLSPALRCGVRICNAAPRRLFARWASQPPNAQRAANSGALPLHPLPFWGSQTPSPPIPKRAVI